jgi:cellulose biosynthesis protein BcsQ
MKVVFWSPLHGQAGMTSNITIISLLFGMLLKLKCLLTQTHFNYNNLEAPLVGSNSKGDEKSGYFVDVGLDALVRSFKSVKLNREAVENCCIALEAANLKLLPGTSKANRETFEHEMGLVALKLFQEVENFYDVVFIDASPAQNELSMKLMEKADVTVVNLSQNLGIVDMFIKQYKPGITGKIFYLFGSYDGMSKYNIKNIRRRYKDIGRNNSGVIPYCTAYMDAQVDCTVTEFVKNNLNCDKKDENHYFIMKSISAAEKLAKMLHANIETEEEN